MSLTSGMSRISSSESLAPSFQPLAEAASRSRTMRMRISDEDPSAFSDEERDHVGLEYRPVLGEEDPEDEQENSAKMKQAQEDEDWNLLAELQFKSRVAAVTRVTPKHQRMWLTPAKRFSRRRKSAVGDGWSAVGDGWCPGVDGTISMDMDLHAWVVPLGKPFDLEALSAKYAPPDHAVNVAEKFFVGMATSFSISSRKRLEEQPLALRGTAAGGWKLGDELPDTDKLTGEPISDWAFHQRWNQDARNLMHHLIKKHEGELKELEGHWVESSDLVSSIPDALFDPQFSLNELDFETARWLDEPRRASSSMHADTYLIMAKGKGKKPAVGGKGGKGKPGGQGKPAVGGKGQWIVDNKNGEWLSSALQMSPTGWRYREGSCIDLPTVFLKLGKWYTATQLYRYWNTLPPFVSKRPHSWSSPWVAQAAHERFKETGYYGHRKR